MRDDSHSARMNLRIVAALFVMLFAQLLSGCGSSDFEYATVSGRITLDGEPVSNARVVFVPQRSEGRTEVGSYSAGTTDAEGKYRLKTIASSPRNGAVIGNHRVTASTRVVRVDPADPERVITDVEEIFPENVTNRHRTPLYYKVPAGGTSEANFDIASEE